MTPEHYQLSELGLVKVRSARLALATAVDHEADAETSVPNATRRRLLAGLGADGTRLVRDLLRAYGPWTVTDLVTLRRLAETQDTLAALQAAIQADGGPVRTGTRGARKSHPLLAAVRAETRTLESLFRQLNLRS
jgi:hypothetical protein